MTDVDWVRIRSWHAIALTYRSGAVKTRCGRMAVVQGTLSTPEGVNPTIRPTSDRLPLNEPSCESCTRLLAHDAEPAVSPL